MPTEEQPDDGYEYLSFTEVKNTIDLILLYIDINKKVIDTKKVSRGFLKFTETLVQIKEQLLKIRLEPIPQNNLPAIQT